MQSTETLKGFFLQPKEANTSYLMMARSMIELDRTGAMRALGLSSESAEVLLRLSPAEILRIAQYEGF